MNRKLHLPLALALALGSSQVMALGLGQIEVKSSLYQPLDAEIPVLSTTPAEATQLKVRLASAEDLARIGISRPTMMTANLEFSVQKDADGNPVIRVSTDSKISDPFVTFLLEVDWGKGRLLREFTVLLDPPLTAPISGSQPTAHAVSPVEPMPSESAAVEPAPVAETAAPAEAAPTASIPAETSPAAEPVAPVVASPTSAPVAEATPAPEPQPTAATEPPPATLSDQYGPVPGGDTLWSIATQARPAGVDMNQTMLALLNANPDAFIDNNINRLKKGAILRIPSASEMVQTSLTDARAEVARQMDDWRASTAQVLPQPEVAAPFSSAAPTEQPSADRSRLELTPPKGEAVGSSVQSGVAANSAGTELRHDLQRAQEDLSARNQEVNELKSRVSELESIEGDSKRLISMQNSELARLRERLAELQAKDDADAAAKAAAATAAEQPSAAADVLTTAESAPADATLDSTQPATETVATADDTAAQPDAGTEAVTPPPGAKPATTPAAAAASSAPSTATPSTPPQRALPWYRNLWVMIGGGVLAVGLLLLAVLKLGRGGKPKPEPSRRVSESLGASHMAAHAADDDGMSDREIELLEGLSAQPEDLDRHLELVRYYYEQGNSDAFEGAAEAMYAQCADDPANLAWRQVVAMGREVIPDHPMFAEDAVHSHTHVDVAEKLDHTMDAARNTVVGVAAAAREDVSLPGFEAPAPKPATLPPTPKMEPVPAPERVKPPEPVNLSPAPASNTATVSAGGMDEDAAATKLELARAYLDMGDVEGARGMLEEVVGEGTSTQRDEARRLLDEIR